MTPSGLAREREQESERESERARELLRVSYAVSVQSLFFRTPGEWGSPHSTTYCTGFFCLFCVTFCCLSVLSSFDAAVYLCIYLSLLLPHIGHYFRVKSLSLSLSGARARPGALKTNTRGTHREVTCKGSSSQRLSLKVV